MSPFDYMAQSLAKPDLPPSRTPGRTARMRAELATGPKTAAELAAAAGVRSALVQALLKGDLAAGRVRRLDGRYELVPEHVARLELQIRAAVRLLEAHGYTVTREAA